MKTLLYLLARAHGTQLVPGPRSCRHEFLSSRVQCSSGSQGKLSVCWSPGQLLCSFRSHLVMAALQVAADTFIYTPLNIVLFFTLMTRAVAGGTWQA